MSVASERVSSPDRRLAALAKANDVRRARAQLKARVARGEQAVANILLERPAEALTMSVAELLGAQRSWGQVRTRRALRNLSIPEGKQLRRLTARQVRMLLGLLRSLDEPARSSGQPPEPAIAP